MRWLGVNLIMFGIMLGLLLPINQSASAISDASPFRQQTSTPTPTPQAKFFRTVNIVTQVQVVNTVRIRSEPTTAGGNATVIMTAQPGDEFTIRQDVDWAQADNYTWLPVIADNQDVWVAQEGFLNLIEGPVQVPISQDEIDSVYANLPRGAEEVLAIDGRLVAVDAEGEEVAVWDWGNNPDQGIWVYPMTVDFEPNPDLIGNGKYLTPEIIAQLEAEAGGEFDFNIKRMMFRPGVPLPADHILIEPLDERWDYSDDYPSSSTHILEVSLFYLGTINHPSSDEVKIPIFAYLRPDLGLVNYVTTGISDRNVPAYGSLVVIDGDLTTNSASIPHQQRFSANTPFYGVGSVPPTTHDYCQILLANLEPGEQVLLRIGLGGNGLGNDTTFEEATRLLEGQLGELVIELNGMYSQIHFAQN